jgi:hypothetical protein
MKASNKIRQLLGINNKIKSIIDNNVKINSGVFAISGKIQPRRKLSHKIMNSIATPESKVTYIFYLESISINSFVKNHNPNIEIVQCDNYKSLLIEIDDFYKNKEMKYVFIDDFNQIIGSGDKKIDVANWICSQFKSGDPASKLAVLIEDLKRLSTILIESCQQIVSIDPHSEIQNQFVLTLVKNRYRPTFKETLSKYLTIESKDLQ